MTDETQAAAMLRSSSRLRDDRDFATYERALERLAESLDPRDLPAIYQAFDDGTADHGVFWSLVHPVDRYDRRTTARVYASLLVGLASVRDSGPAEALAVRAEQALGDL